MCFLCLVPSPAPPPGSDPVYPAIRSPLGPTSPPVVPGKRRPTERLNQGLISAAHLEASWGLAGRLAGDVAWKLVRRLRVYGANWEPCWEAS